MFTTMDSTLKLTFSFSMENRSMLHDVRAAAEGRKKAASTHLQFQTRFLHLAPRIGKGVGKAWEGFGKALGKLLALCFDKGAFIPSVREGATARSTETYPELQLPSREPAGPKCLTMMRPVLPGPPG